MRTYLGVDGGGSKTAFMLIDESGQVLATHTEGTAYYLEIGWDELRNRLACGIRATLDAGSVPAANLDFAFLGLPAYGEDSRLLSRFDALPTPPLASGRYHCGNDAACGWAGALACEDGISLVAGTGSIGYGEYQGRAARAGGWGELFSDEGSAYWMAREALGVFSRMSDGRMARGLWYDLVRQHFGLAAGLGFVRGHLWRRRGRPQPDRHAGAAGEPRRARRRCADHDAVFSGGGRAGENRPGRV